MILSLFVAGSVLRAGFEVWKQFGDRIFRGRRSTCVLVAGAGVQIFVAGAGYREVASCGGVSVALVGVCAVRWGLAAEALYEWRKSCAKRSLSKCEFWRKPCTILEDLEEVSYETLALQT